MKNSKLLFPLKEKSPFPWLWIGTWSMGGEGFGKHDEREALKVLATAVENGICHFDTAGFYAHGRSELLLSNIIRSNRQNFFISTKGGLAWEGRNVRHSASPESLRVQLHESLERLGTDYIDLYQLHWPDPEISLQESIDALKGFQKEDLIRFWGVGNLTKERVESYLAEEKDVPHQVHFNPVHRGHELLEAGEASCINCIISPLEQGLLGTGRSSAGKGGISKNDIRNRNPYFSDTEVLEWNRQLDRLAACHRISKVSSVLSWICSQPHVHAIIPGPRRLEQLNEILQFLRDIEDLDLYSDESGISILSREKTRGITGSDVLDLLDRGPAVLKINTTSSSHNCRPFRSD